MAHQDRRVDGFGHVIEPAPVAPPQEQSQAEGQAGTSPGGGNPSVAAGSFSDPAKSKKKPAATKKAKR